MEAVKLFDKKKAAVDWDMTERRTLYILVWKASVGVDVGEGVVVRYDEKAKEA